MDTIDVRGLPDPVTRVLQTMVQIFRQQLHAEDSPRSNVSLPVKHGNVIGGLTREEIYGDALR